MAVAADAPAVSPSLDEVRALARDHNLIPLRHSFIDDCETPVSAFLKLREDGPAFLLESADQGQRVGRYSFIGFRPREVIRWSLGDAGDPFEIAAAAVHRPRQAPLPDLPPFAGGAVGVFGYDLVRTVEPLSEPNPDPVGVPDLALMLTDVLVVFDHLKHTVSVLANVYAEDEVDTAYAAARDAIADVRWRLAGPVPQARHAPDPARVMPGFESNMARVDFEGIVARIVEYVHAGDAFQVVPSQRWSAAAPVEPFSIYRGLRAVNPSPYMYFLDFGDFQVAGASPEPLLTVSGRRVSTRPIAGTRPRGAPLGCAQGAGDADHRRGRAGQARRLRGRDRLAGLHRRPGHLHPHPHRRGQGRRRARPGWGRHGGRRQARLRVRGVGRQGARRPAGDRARRRAGGLGLTAGGDPWTSSSSTTTTASPTTSSSTWASWEPG